MNADEIETLLDALGAQLDGAGTEAIELVVCGGTAMNLHGFISRATKDVDVVAIRAEVAEGPYYITSNPLPDVVLAARERVARDFGAPVDWLNDGPADIMRFGLPAGFEARLVERRYGDRLVIQLLGRFDLICLKLDALVNTDAGSRHFQDLVALGPTTAEFRDAAAWTLTQNEPDGYLLGLRGALRALGADDVARELA